MKKLIILLLLLGAVTVHAVTIYQSGYLWQWTSSEPSRVLVDPRTGWVTPMSKGSADICAQLKSDLSIKFCTTVTVK